MKKPDLSSVDLITHIEKDTPLKKVSNTGNGEYAGPCPWCGGEDRFRVWRKDEKSGKGQYRCRQCGEKGDVLDYVQSRYGIEDFNSKLEFLGITPPADSNEGGAPSAKITQVYAYRQADGQRLYEIVRFEPKAYKPRQLNGTFGYGAVQRVLYDLPEVIRAGKNGEPIYLVEGEKTAEAVKRCGLITTTIPGGANGKWEPQYTEALSDSHVVILRDQDEVGHQYGERAAGELYGKAASVKVIDLPGLQFRPSHGDDPEVWLNQGHTATELQEIVAAASEWERAASLITQPDGIYLLTPEEILNMPPIEYLLDGEIPRDGLVVLYGESGIGKTFLALDRALTIAQEHCVVYVAGEGQSGYGDRIRAWMQHNQCDMGLFRLIVTSVSLMDENCVEELTEKTLPLKPALIVFDTLAMVMTDGDENSAKDMGHLVRACRRIQKKTGAAIMLVHHSGKNGGVERGSSALRGAADVMIEVWKDDLVNVKCTKTKDAEKFPPRHYHLETVETRSDITSCVVVPAETRKSLAARNGLNRRQQAILKIMVQEEYQQNGITPKVLGEAPNVGEYNLNREIKALKRLGYIQQTEPRKPYFITTAGATLVEPSKEEAIMASTTIALLSQ